jgi:hypothetical protein
MPDDDMSPEITESDSPPAGWVAFEIPAELRLRAEDIVEQLRAGPDKQQHAAELIEIVVALTDRGLYYYFLHPLEEARVGVMTRKAVELALGTAGRTLPMVVRKTVNSLNDAQLSSLADFIDHILIREEDSSDP